MFSLGTWFVKEHIGFLKLTDTFDIINPADQSHVGIAKENPGTLMTLLRLVIDKRLLPTRVDVYEGSDPNGTPAFSIKRGFTLLRSRIDVVTGDGTVLGYFKQKLLSLGGTFFVFDASDNQIALVKGDWKGWNFRFLAGNDQELGCVTKKWAGLGRELLTSADQYVISLNGAPNRTIATLLLAAGLAIDTVFKEKA